MLNPFTNKESSEAIIFDLSFGDFKRYKYVFDLVVDYTDAKGSELEQAITDIIRKHVGEKGYEVFVLHYVGSFNVNTRKFNQFSSVGSEKEVQYVHSVIDKMEQIIPEVSEAKVKYIFA